MNVGEKIKNAREENEMTQEALAEKVGVSRRTIQRFEKNANASNFETLKAIAGALGLKIHELYQEKSEYERKKLYDNHFLIGATNCSEYSAEEIAKKTGIEVNRYNDFLKGYEQPTEDEYFKISEVTGASVEMLKRQSDPVKPDVEHAKEMLIESVNFALEHAPGEEKKKEEYIRRLDRIINNYGSMSQHTYVMALSSKDNPDDYLRVIQFYERILKLANEHKDFVIQNAFDWLEDNSELKALIYGEDLED